MDFNILKKQYDELVYNKKREEKILDKNTEIFNSKHTEVKKLEEEMTTADKEVNDTFEKYNEVFEKKFSKLEIKLGFSLSILILVIEAILYSQKGIYALLGLPFTTLVGVMAYSSIYFIKYLKPNWLEILWWNDKTLNQLGATLAEKRNKLSKITLEHANAVEELSSINNKIDISKNVIETLEKEINQIMVQYATPIFEHNDNEKDNTESKHLTKVRRLEDDKTRD